MMLPGCCEQYLTGWHFSEPAILQEKLKWVGTNRLFFRHMNLNTYVNYKICSKFVLKTIDLYLEVDSRLRPITLYKHQKGTVQPLLLATKAQRESIFFKVLFELISPYFCFYCIKITRSKRQFFLSTIRRNF